MIGFWIRISTQRSQHLLIIVMIYTWRCPHLHLSDGYGSKGTRTYTTAEQRYVQSTNPSLTPPCHGTRPAHAVLPRAAVKAIFPRGLLFDAPRHVRCLPGMPDFPPHSSEIHPPCPYRAMKTALRPASSPAFAWNDRAHRGRLHCSGYENFSRSKGHFISGYG